MGKKIKFCSYMIGLLALMLISSGVVKADIPEPNGAILQLRSPLNIIVGDVFTVKINLNTVGFATDGVDIRYLNYPQDLLEVQDADVSKSGVQIAPGVLYPNTLTNEVLIDEGKINFSQVTMGGQHYSGEGVLASITFKVIGEGSAHLSFDFVEGSGKDCNVASKGEDILKMALDISLVLGGEDAGQPVEPSTEPPAEPPIVDKDISSEPSRISPWIILGASIGAVAALIVLIVWLYIKKRSQQF